MAPEYVIAGHYSVKSDVYSFGILILEIVSGQLNNFFRLDGNEESLLDRVSYAHLFIPLMLLHE